MRKALYILAGLKDDDLRWFSDHGRYREIEKDATLIVRERPIDQLYIIISGKFEIRNATGKPVAEVASGDILGEMSLVEKQPPSVSVAALETAKVLAVPLALIEQRLTDDEGFAARFYRALAVFLSARLRATVATLGYGDENEENEEALFEARHGLDDGLLDTLHVAGDRMVRLINILEGREE